MTMQARNENEFRDELTSKLNKVAQEKEFHDEKEFRKTLAPNVLKSVEKKKENGDTIQGVEEFDFDHQTSISDIFAEFSETKDEKEKPQEEEEEKEEISVVLHDTKKDIIIQDKFNPISMMETENNNNVESKSMDDISVSYSSSKTMIASLISSIAFGFGLKNLKGMNMTKSSLSSISAFAICCFLEYRRQCSNKLLPSSTSSTMSFTAPISIGAPKIVSSVRSANDLLIKIIARETASLQEKLKIDHENENNGIQNGLIKQTKRIVNMSQGVPCLPIFEASHKAMTQILNTRLLPYSNVAGQSEIRTSAALFVNQFYNNMEFDESNVIITAGAIQAIYNCMALSIEGPNDIVATTVPAYGLYQQQTKLLRGTFTTLNELTPQALYELFHKNNVAGTKQRIRCLVLCVPNNPTGKMITSEEAYDLCIALDNIWEEYYSNDPLGGFSVILDEVYLGITAKPVQSMLCHASDRLRQSMFLVLSCSKGLGAMPGARAAWITSPNKQAIEELGKIQLVCTGNASTISQAGLKGSLDFLRENPSEMQRVWIYYHERTSLVVSGLQKLALKYNLGTIAESSQATFYVWASFDKLPRIKGKSQTDIEFIEYLRSLYLYEKKSLKKSNSSNSLSNLTNENKSNNNDNEYYCGVAVVPGSAFEVSPYELKVRFSCACGNKHDLIEAMESIEFAIANICIEAKEEIRQENLKK